jgi:hypothetical protein
LVLEIFQWENELVDAHCELVHQRDDIIRAQVYEAIGASQGLRDCNLPRAVATKRSVTSVTPSMARKKEIHEDEELSEEDVTVKEDYSPTEEMEEKKMIMRMVEMVP